MKWMKFNKAGCGKQEIFLVACCWMLVTCLKPTLNEIVLVFLLPAFYIAVMKEPIPIEERDDITVDEMEHISLPCRADLYNGRIVCRMATFAHGLVEANVAWLLGKYLDKRPIGMVAIGVNFRLWNDRPKESRVADVCFIANERVPKNNRCFPAMAPDLAVEIVQPDDDFAETMDKADAYLQQGTKIVWLVLISTREVLICTVEVKYSVRDVLTAPSLLPDFELPVLAIFEGLDM